MQAAEKEAHKKEEAKKLKKQEKAKQKKAAKDADSAERAPRKQKQQQQPQGGKRSKQSGHVFFESSSDEEGAEPVAKKPRGKLHLYSCSLLWHAHVVHVLHVHVHVHVHVYNILCQTFIESSCILM